jgi:hypothetical protein
VTNYRAEAEDDARSTVSEFADQIVEQIMDDGKASDDLLNDYPNGDAYHHESHVDRDYRLTEAADLLDHLSDFEERDSGLWEGLEPRKAIAAQAAYTYGNAVLSFFRDLIEEINGHMVDVDTGREGAENTVAEAVKAVAEGREPKISRPPGPKTWSPRKKE